MNTSANTDTKSEKLPADFRYKHLSAILTENNQKSVAIFIGIPDPDSIGSGLGMKLLIEYLTGGATCDLIYTGEVSHPQNKTLINVLNITLIHQDDVLKSTEKPLTEQYDRFVFVDHIPRERWAKDLNNTVIIDHHKVTYDKGDFVDIRQVGSCCSMVLSYIREEKIDFTKDDDGGASRVATAMLFGVKTDTQDLMAENTTNLDFEAYQYLVKYVDKTDLEPIINYQLPAYYFEIRGRLEEEDNRDIKGAFFVGGVGILSTARRDCLPMLADERVRMEGISTAVIFALVGNGIEASVRSTNAAIDVNSFCQKIFGKDFAGGKSGAGAAKIPMGVFGVDSLNVEMKGEAWEMYRKIIMTKILRVCGSE